MLWSDMRTFYFITIRQQEKAILNRYTKTLNSSLKCQKKPTTIYPSETNKVNYFLL